MTTAAHGQPAADFFITPGLLEGTVTPPSSKSQTYRAILARLLAEGGVLTVRES